MTVWQTVATCSMDDVSRVSFAFDAAAGGAIGAAVVWALLNLIRLFRPIVFDRMKGGGRG